MKFVLVKDLDELSEAFKQQMLKYMYSSRNRVNIAITTGTTPREQIEQHVWSFDYEGGSNMVDVYIRYLRKKIDEGFSQKLIHTVRG